MSFTFHINNSGITLAHTRFWHFLNTRKDQNMVNPKERRNYPRVKIKLPVVKMAGNGLLNGEIRDLSMGGAFIRCQEMLNSKDKFHMVISAKGRLMSIIGEVVWQDVNKINNKTTMRGMGVQFRQVFSGDRRFLREVIASHHSNKLTAWLPRLRKTNR
jgi:c-di-GMP-binding flagellar brake protein YcgR